MLDASHHGAPCNALTIDVEDWFQVSALAPHVPRERWATSECRVETNVMRLLELLARHQTRATFFTLGWVGQRYPSVVREIVAGGHELASHGYGHQRVSDLTLTEFHNDVTRAKHLLEDLGGVAVAGYRAPSFSIGRDNLWAFDVLRDAGYRYSSSVYPVAHDHYGMPDAPRVPYCTQSGVIEIPPSTVKQFGRIWAASGGGWFRFWPYTVSRALIRGAAHELAQPAVFYLHPWEIDPGQPRVRGVGLKTRVRHYLNLDRTYARLEQLLSDFCWDRMDRAFDLTAIGQLTPWKLAA